MKILVTGGTGFLGKNIALRLLAAGHTVTILGRNKTVGAELASQGIRFLPVELSDKEKMIAACEQQEIVVHSGALASPWGAYELFYQTNVIGTRNLLAGCDKFGVRRLVNISTPSIYFDFNHRFNIRESDPLPKRQYTNYSATKLIADDDIANAKHLETISIRPRAIFGAGDQTVLGRVLRLAESGRVPLINRGASSVDLTYIDNVVDAIVLCIHAKNSCLGKVYNITNGESMSVKTMLDTLFSALDLKICYRNLPYSVVYTAASILETSYKILGRTEEPVLTKYGVGLMSRSQTLNIDTARAELGYQPKITIADGMRIYAKWWKKEGRNR